jgi:hypothetical protein
VDAACKGLQAEVTVSALLLEVCWPPEAGGGDGSVAPASYKCTRVTADCLYFPSEKDSLNVSNMKNTDNTENSAKHNVSTLCSCCVSSLVRS